MMTATGRKHVVKFGRGGKRGYEYQITVTTTQRERLEKSLLANDKWFVYETQFGEMRFVNLTRFDTVDFKENTTTT
jgi:hypothetical protein